MTLAGASVAPTIFIGNAIKMKFFDGNSQHLKLRFSIIILLFPNNILWTGKVSSVSGDKVSIPIPLIFFYETKNSATSLLNTGKWNYPSASLF